MIEIEQNHAYLLHAAISLCCGKCGKIFTDFPTDTPSQTMFFCSLSSSSLEFAEDRTAEQFDWPKLPTSGKHVHTLTEVCVGAIPPDQFQGC